MRATPPHPQRVFMQQRPLTLLRQVRASGFQLRRVLADAEFRRQQHLSSDLASAASSAWVSTKRRPSTRRFCEPAG